MTMMALLGLFGAAFVAASVLPGSSEAVILLLLARGSEPLLLWVVATIGNVLGAVLNWGLGIWAMAYRDRRWFPVRQTSLDWAQARFHRWGLASLLLSWVPGIGDAFTVAAGALRIPLGIFLVLVTIAKGGRYAAVIWIADDLGLGQAGVDLAARLLGGLG